MVGVHHRGDGPLPSVADRYTDRCPLTESEHRVIVELMRGRSYAETAEEIGVSVSTVRSQAHTAYRRMGVSGLGPAIAMMHRERWVNEPLLPSYRAPVFAFSRRQRMVESWRPSPAQRVYLDAFDRLLRDRTGRAAEVVDAAFTVMCGEAGTSVRRDGADRSVDGMLERIANGLLRRIPDGEG